MEILLSRYHDLVLEYAKVMNLTAWDSDELWQKGINPSRKFAEQIPYGAKVLDVGSGQGLPGMVIAILRPDCVVTMIEPRAKRVAFLNLVKYRLKLNCEVILTRAQEHSGLYDIIVSRALASAEQLIEWTKHLSCPESKWLIHKQDDVEHIDNRIVYISYEL